MPPSSLPARHPQRPAVSVLAALVASGLVASVLVLGAPATPPASADAAPAPDPCADAPRTAFVDVQAIAEAQRDAVQCLAAYGITRGVDDRPTFAPAAPVTREQLATFLARTAMQARHGHLEIPHEAIPRFDDVSPGNVHAPAIGWLAEHGIAAGTGARTFTPDGVVTRQQLASFLARLLRELGAYEDLELDAVLDAFEHESFTDLDRAAPVHRAGIEVLQALEVVGGFADGTFRPDEAVTRQQLAGFVVGAARLLAGQGAFDGRYLDVED